MMAFDYAVYKGAFAGMSNKIARYCTSIAGRRFSPVWGEDHSIGLTYIVRAHGKGSCFVEITHPDGTEKVVNGSMLFSTDGRVRRRPHYSLLDR